MLTTTGNDRPSLTWQNRLDRTARQMASEFVRFFPEADGREQAAGIVLALAQEAIRPEAEVPTRTRMRLDGGHIVDCISEPGILRMAFEGEIDNWTEPTTAARILAIVRAAVVDELDLHPSFIRVGRWSEANVGK